MGGVARTGRTVLFVSHNLAAVQNLCNRALLIDKGEIICEGATELVLEKYVSLFQKNSFIPVNQRSDRKGDGPLRFKSFHIKTPKRGITDVIFTGESVTFTVEYSAEGSSPLHNVSVAIPFNNHMGQHIFMVWTRVTGQDFSQIPINEE